MSGAKIIKGLEEARDGEFARVTRVRVPGFTPGPWRMCGGYTPHFVAIHAGDHGYVVFGMADPDYDREGVPAKSIVAPCPETQRANARLISAAPDLYAAAKRALAVLKATGESVRPGNALGALEAALTKAEGREPSKKGR